MPYLLKNLFRTSVAESIVNEISNKTNRFYYFFGKTDAWPSSDVAPTANDSFFNELRARDTMVYAKQIQGTDVCLVADRINWAVGQIFDYYDDRYSTEVVGLNLTSGGSGYTTAPTVAITGTGTGATATATISTITGKVTGLTVVSPGTGYIQSTITPLTVTMTGGGGTGATAAGVLAIGQNDVSRLKDSRYYVFTDDYNVYVCLDNNSKAFTTEKPYGASSTPITTADGYIWKYLYTVPIALRERFLSSLYIPVSTSLKQQFFSSGAISAVRIDSPGVAYTGVTQITTSGDGFLASDPYWLTSLTITTAGAGYTTATIAIAPPFGGSLASTAWVTARVYIAGQYVSNGNNIYQISIGGTSTVTAPTHITGSVTIGPTYTYVGTAATATANLVGGAITSVTRVMGVRDIAITNGGTGYANGPNTVSLSSGTGVAVAYAQGGIIYRIDVTDPGFGYTVTPTITGIAGGGTGFVGTVLMKMGAGYTATPTVTVTGTGTITTTAVLTPSMLKSEARIFPIMSGGAISSLQIVDGGVAYTNATLTVTGTATTAALLTPSLAVGDVTTLQSSTELTAVDGAIYNIRVVSGGYGYASQPTVIISGDGTGATATAFLDSNGAVFKITVSNAGSGYHTANVQIVGDGVGATARAIIPPNGGHGRNVVKDLGTRDLMIFSYLSKDKVNGLNLGNQYRQFGLLKNPKAFDTSQLNALTATACWQLIATASIPAAFVNGVVITSVPLTGQLITTVSSVTSSTVFTVTSATGLLTGMSLAGSGITPGTTISVSSTNTITLSQPATGLTNGLSFRFNWLASYRVSYVSGTNILLMSLGNVSPIVSDTFNYSASAFTAAAITAPSIDKYSGDLLYLNNQAPFTPQDGTSEKITVSTVLKF